MSVCTRVFQNGVLGFVGKPRVGLAVVSDARPHRNMCIPICFHHVVKIDQNSFRIFGVLAHLVETRFHLLRHFISRNTRIVTSEVNLSVLMLQIKFIALENQACRHLKGGISEKLFHFM